VRRKVDEPGDAGQTVQSVLLRLQQLILASASVGWEAGMAYPLRYTELSHAKPRSELGSRGGARASHNQRGVKNNFQLFFTKRITTR
jgi:hypothetical protein